MEPSQARDEIRQAIKQAGGVYEVAERSGVHFTRIYAFLRGAMMEPENAGRLRAELPGLPADVWANIFAPRLEDQPTTPDATP
jgi:hypothetical protein